LQNLRVQKVTVEQQKLRSLQQQGTLNPRPQDVTDERFQDSDFLDPKDIVQVKYEMLRRVQVDKASVSRSAKSFGFSRPSYYQAHAAFTQGGLAGLLPQKRGPRRAHKLDPNVMEFLQQSRHDQPALTSQELVVMVHKAFGIHVHRRSVERALRRHQKKPR
jgi:transposase